MSNRIKHLVILTGPMGVGKSTTLTSLLDPESETIPGLNSIDLDSSWEIWNPASFLKRDIDVPLPERMIFQYELTRLITRPGFSLTDFDKDPALEIRRLTERISLITLWAPGEIIARRVKSRMPLAIRVMENFNPSRRHLAAFELYSDPSKLATLYLNWLEFWALNALESNLVIDISNEQSSLIPLAEFMNFLQAENLSPSK